MSVTALLQPLSATTPAASPRLVVVAPDAVPPGATVVGVLVIDGGHEPPQRTVPAPRLIARAAPDGGPVQVDPVQVDPVQIDPDSREVLVDHRSVVLTRREFDLLHRLTQAPGLVFARTRLLRDVWGYDGDAYVSGRTVDVHVTRLRRKLGAHADRLQTVRGVGYRWIRPATPSRGGPPCPSTAHRT